MELLNSSLGSVFSRRIILSLALSVLLAIILEIWAVNRLSAYGQQISKIELSSSKIQMENQILQNQIDQKSSLVTTLEKAKALGLQKIQNMSYLQQPNLALNN